MSRHYSVRSWQRYKRIKALPSAPPKRFSALQLVDKALDRFEPMRIKDFQLSSAHASVGREE